MTLHALEFGLASLSANQTVVVLATTIQNSHPHFRVFRAVRIFFTLLQGGDLIRDLLNIEVVAKLNSAFCSLHHLKHCLHDTSVRQQCAQVGHTPEKG